jgi:hypothetical protein
MCTIVLAARSLNLEISYKYNDRVNSRDTRSRLTTMSMTRVLGRDVASWDGDRERPRTPLQDVGCDGASGTLARVPGRSERPETGWRVPGQFGRPWTVWEAFRTDEVSRDGAQRPGTGGAPWDARAPS